ncbi:GDSL-like Lipase/Acylhydrolase [Aureococcus anophagefferens]|nr:GDSL-like Lipase/Acylhydrolase [Aureococcus anophagefferens]
MFDMPLVAERLGWILFELCCAMDGPEVKRTDAEDLLVKKCFELLWRLRFHRGSKIFANCCELVTRKCVLTAAISYIYDPRAQERRDVRHPLDGPVRDARPSGLDCCLRALEGMSIYDATLNNAKGASRLSRAADAARALKATGDLRARRSPTPGASTPSRPPRRARACSAASARAAGGVAEKLLGPGYAVVEEGLNGRTTVHPDPLMGDYDANGRATLAAILHSHKPFDVVVLMLGTNDLKTHLALTPEQIAKGASTLVGDVFKMGVTRSAERPKVLLVAPPKVWDKPEWGFAGARSRSDACRACYAAEAEAHGCAFLDANDVFAIPDPAKEGGDGIHLSPANAKAPGAAVAAKIESMMAYKF